MKKSTFTFLTVGKTVEQKSDFKRYVGVAQSKVVALNPSKKQLEEIYGREVQNDPEYFGTDEETGVKWARLDFIVKTIPEACNGIELLSHATFTIRNEMYSNRDNTKVRVLDSYGNSTWMDTEAAKNHQKPLSSSGTPVKIADYRIARRGEPELIDFLRKYISTPEQFEYVNGVWSLKNLKHESELTKEEAEKDDLLTYEKCMMALDKEDFENFFKGNVSALWDQLSARMKMEPLAITLLYGVRTNEEGKQYQSVCTSYDMMLRKNYTSRMLQNLEKQLTNAKASGMYASTDYRVQELQEYDVKATNLEQPAPAADDSEMPW